MFNRALLAILLLSALPVGAQNAGLAERIPPLEATSDIEVSKESSDSGAYIVVHRSGKLTYVPFRSQSFAHSAHRQTTKHAVVNFAVVYRQIVAVAVADKISPADHLVYFSARNAASSTAVFVPAARASIAEALFEAFVNATKK
jgi:hypothetical protein